MILLWLFFVSFASHYYLYYVYSMLVSSHFQTRANVLEKDSICHVNAALFYRRNKTCRQIWMPQTLCEQSTLLYSLLQEHLVCPKNGKFALLVDDLLCDDVNLPLQAISLGAVHSGGMMTKGHMSITLKGKDRLQVVISMSLCSYLITVKFPK